jgi:hypothetical protein
LFLRIAGGKRWGWHYGTVTTIKEIYIIKRLRQAEFRLQDVGGKRWG